MIIKQYVCVKQHDITDCAAACLATIAKQYGLKIAHISVDTRFDQQTLDNYYIAEATIDNDSINSFKGDQARVKVGMLCEAQIITKSKRLLFYLLEKIALLH